MNINQKINQLINEKENFIKNYELKIKDNIIENKNIEINK